ncbi:MAG: hypothetical protein NTZ49_05745 [Candidatus Parcubacteria bacterium]|nr:hypothetical protein [Candidatus Parcubacteria bacterium]
MENNTISSKIIEQLKEKHISPKPKWEFVLKNTALWLFLAVLLIVGSLASSVIIFMIDTNQWDLYEKARHNLFAFILASLPYFWLVLLGLFLAAIYYYFFKTKNGYKYHAYAVILGSFILSIFLGLIFYNSGLAHAIDEVFNRRMPFYTEWLNPRQKIFNRPEFGVLPGQIIQVVSPNELILTDIKNENWKVLISPEIINCPCSLGNHIIAVGEEENNYIFKAVEIRELRPHFVPPHQLHQYFELRILQPR